MSLNQPFKIPDRKITSATGSTYLICLLHSTIRFICPPKTLIQLSTVPLALLHHPLCITMHYYETGEKILVDATLIEQQCSEGEIVIAANAQGEVCLMQKGGEGEVDALSLLRCVEMAVGKVQELSKVLERALEKDAKMRDKGGISAELSAENER